MNLRSLTENTSWKGKRVLVRVDFNVPLDAAVDQESFLKISRSLETIHWLQNKGAVVILLTHLGRPEKRDPKLSTKHLLPILTKQKLVPIFHSENIDLVKERVQLKEVLEQAQPGSVHLLENVRFSPGEEKNTPALAKAYASLADLFVNEAFAVCHRKQASVVALAKQLPAFAGFALQKEVEWLEKLLKKPKFPFITFLGGKKLSTKIPVIKALLPLCDQLFLGGAMSVTCAAAQGKKVGASFVETTMLSTAKTLIKQKKLVLPLDLVVSRSASEVKDRRIATFDDIQSKEIVVDVGPQTLKMWADAIKEAKTVLWNGPVGITEVKEFGAGSRGLARFIGHHAKGKMMGVAGGGDTLPVIFAAKVEDEFDYLSTGGGALLEFLTMNGKLPGLLSLEK